MVPGGGVQQPTQPPAEDVPPEQTSEDEFDRIYNQLTNPRQRDRGYMFSPETPNTLIQPGGPTSATYPTTGSQSGAGAVPFVGSGMAAGYGYAPAGAATTTAQGEQIQPRNQWDGNYYTADGRKLTPDELKQYGFV